MHQDTRPRSRNYNISKLPRIFWDALQKKCLHNVVLPHWSEVSNAKKIESHTLGASIVSLAFPGSKKPHRRGIATDGDFWLSCMRLCDCNMRRSYPRVCHQPEFYIFSVEYKLNHVAWKFPFPGWIIVGWIIVKTELCKFASHWPGLFCGTITNRLPLQNLQV